MKSNRALGFALAGLAASVLLAPHCRQTRVMPEIGSALHHDVSPALRDIAAEARDAVTSREVTTIEIPLRIPARAPQGATQRSPEAATSAGGAPPTTLTGSTTTEEDPPLPEPSTTPGVSLDFEGLGNADNAAVVGFRLTPPDTQGDIGPDHYVQWINIVFQIWEISRDANGDPIGANPVFPQALPGNAIWSGFGGPCEFNNDGDPIVLYDHLADRWLFSQFSVDEGIQCVALSQTPDPAGPYDRWAFLVSPGQANDYPKFGIMPDAYYLTLRDFPSNDGIASAVAFDRADMLAGSGAPTFVKFSLPCLPNDCVDGLQPPHLEGPPPAPDTPGIFTKVWDDDFSGPLTGVDGIRLWEFRPDFANPPASTFIELPIVASSADFDSDMCGFFNRDCIPQASSGQRLDPIDELQMYRAQFRHFPSHDSLLVNSTVDSTGTDIAGIYWSELRNSGAGWMQFQDGTYAPADGENRWMGSIAMDGDGNIALGYSVSSFVTNPSIRYVAREATDPPGTLPGGEVEVVAGGSAQTGSNRWGDYSTMSVDPVADCTFWYTTEYYGFGGSINWQSRIAAFKMPSCGGGGGGDLTFYSNRDMFDDRFPGLPCEDFEEGNVAPGDVVGCPAPLNESSNDSCFMPGDIQTGIEFLDDPGPDPFEGLALNFANGAPSKNVVANTFTDSYVINFTGGDTQAAGMDLVSYFSADTCQIDVFGAGGPLGSTTASCTNAGSFWGVSSDSDVITRIVVRAPTNQAEGVDDICFGVEDDEPPPPVVGNVTVSFNVEAGLQNATYGGEVVRPVDAVDLATGNLVFSAFPDTILEDIDAFHILSETESVFSTSTDVTQGFGGVPYIRNGDLVLWDGASATLLFEELVGFGGSQNDIDAFSILPNGNWILSTSLSATLGGLSFENGDIVEYDPVADVATLYMGLDEATIFTGAPQSNPDIDALHAAPDGSVIFSIRSDGIGRVGTGASYGFADVPRTDLFAIDPATLAGSLFLEGDGLFDGVSRNLDAVSLPAGPATTVIEDFDDGDLSEYSFVFGSAGFAVSPQAAHDGPFGLQANGSGWAYRNDSDVRVERGNIVSTWVQASGSSDGRAYFGFGATAAGTLSMVMAPNTNSLLIQRNAGYGFQDIGSSPQVWVPNKWYRMEVLWNANGTIVGNLYDSDGTTLINSVVAMDNTVFSGGIAFRGFGFLDLKFFDTVERQSLSSSSASTVEVPPPPPPCVACGVNFPSP